MPWTRRQAPQKRTVSPQGNPPQVRPDVAPSPPPPPGLIVLTNDGLSITCKSDPFSSGSEGRLFFTQDQKSVVKLYNQPDEWREKSLKKIIEKRDAVLGKQSDYWNHYVCWPEMLVVRPSLGVIMPRVRAELRPFSQFLSPRFRQRIRKEQGAENGSVMLAYLSNLLVQ
jgi:hypothetical protein